MFQINLSKLTPFDTQIATLINLAPDKWVLGTAPLYVCHHEEFGWFCTSLLGLGAQATQINSNQVRRLSWRGQILLRRKVREICRSAVDAEASKAKVVVPHPERDSDHSQRPTWSAALMQRFFDDSPFKQFGVVPPESQGGGAAQQMTATQVQAKMQAFTAQQSGIMQRKIDDLVLRDLMVQGQAMVRQPGNHRVDAFKYMAGAAPQGPVAAPPPAFTKFYSLTQKELLDAGAPPELVKYVFLPHVQPEDAAVESLARWCAENIH